MKKEKAFRTR